MTIGSSVTVCSVVSIFLRDYVTTLCKTSVVPQPHTCAEVTWTTKNRAEEL